MTMRLWGRVPLSALALCVTTAAAAVAGCRPQPENSPSAIMDQQLAADLDLVAGARIYFGHQSVGDNIVAGLADLADGRLDIAPLAPGDAPPDRDAPVFLHSVIGENGSPDSKLAAFAAALDRLDDPRHLVNVALMKFCYLDISADTDVAALHDAYVARLSALQARHPHTRFVHVTVPLTAGAGLKGLIKTLIGRGNPAAANVQRNRYNEHLRERFRDAGIFDLAALESTTADGGRAVFTTGGVSYEELAPEFSSDGAHLNARGRDHAARALVEVLAAALRSPAHAQFLGPAADTARP